MRRNPRPQSLLAHIGVPAALALLYLVVNLLGVIAVESLSTSLELSPKVRSVEIFKESVFASITCLMIYEIARRLQRRVEESHRKVIDSNLEVVRRLATAAEFRDDETGCHNHRIREYAKIVGAALGLSGEDCMLLYYGAGLHDVGKIAIPDDILHKAGDLSPEEREIMKSHVLHGAEILANSSSDEIRVAQSIAMSHHENWDGSGYPFGLCGVQIPIEGRIVAVCDVFDALVSTRPYKGPWLPQAALEEVRGLAGTKFDPHVVEAFASVFEEICLAKSRMQYPSERLAAQSIPLRVVSHQEDGCRSCPGNLCPRCYFRYGREESTGDPEVQRETA